MTNLTNIYLQANRLTELPETVGFLANLETLDVSNNLLTSLPDTLGHLSKLKRLVLTHNQLVCLPDSLGKLQELSSLQLAGNYLSTLPYSSSQCMSLKDVNLDGNRFRSLPNFLTRLDKLESLSVCSNRLENLPSVPFASIKRFHFDGNSFLTHFPYAVACQLSRTPIRPLATRNVIYISCHGCFEAQKNGSLLVNDSTETVDPQWINPGVPVSSQPLASLKELSLRSIFSSIYPQPVVITMHHPSNLHSFKTTYHQDYDRLVLPSISNQLPLNLIQLLREGPFTFCLHCTRPIFSLGPIYPIFVLKMMVSESLSIQPVIVSVYFCSSNCSKYYQTLLDPQLKWKQ